MPYMAIPVDPTNISWYSLIIVSKKNLLILVGLSIIALYLTLIAAIRWSDSTPPRITLKKPFEVVGPATPLSLRVKDDETGLQEVSISITQNLENFPLVTQHFPTHSKLSLETGAEHSFDFEITPYADGKIPQRRGPASLIVTARDYSWREFFEGNTKRLKQEFTVKFIPPRLEILSSPLPISQGGSGVIFYRVSEDAARYGIQIGPTFFPGYPMPDELSHFSLIAFRYNLPTNEPIQLVADDGLGNYAVHTLDLQVIRNKWRSRRIRITDRFITNTVIPIILQTPEIQDQKNSLKNFLEVNSKLRRINDERIMGLSAQTQQKFLWQGPFLQLSNSKVESAFADHRDYLYEGKVVDSADHLGFDLAVTKKYPVEAANDGVVVLAEFLGIYGNTVILDHGYGLQSLYAHLSSFEVKKGDRVAKGQAIARSGTTGLAAGDHLHFSLLLHGIQVNPIEWWDPNWVKTHISNKFKKHEPTKPELSSPQKVGPVFLGPKTQPDF